MMTQSDDTDKRLAALLLADAPPGRDPFFRMSILERRERQRYRRRTVALLVAGLVALAACMVLARFQAGPMVAAAALLLGGMLMFSWFVCAPLVGYLLRRLAAPTRGT